MFGSKEKVMMRNKICEGFLEVNVIVVEFICVLEVVWEVSSEW